jgi:iron complex transport system substrate-binding protein
VTRRIAGRVAVAAAALVAAACGRFGNTDQKGERAQRMVSVSKQHTEIVFALGADSDLVAVDVSSVYPPQARKLPNVGYHRALSLEGMIAARPTLILSGGPGNMGPEPVVRQIEALKIPMKDFDAKGVDIESTKALLREMGAYFHRRRQADSLAAKLDGDMARALAAAKQEADTPRVVIIHYGQAMNVYLTILGRSTAGQMVKWAGGRMAFDDTSGMRQLTSPEIIAKADPDVILLTDFGYDRLAGRADVLKLPGVAATRAARRGRIWRIEENDLVYLGPRTGENVDRIRVLIHQPGTGDSSAVAASR